MKLFKANSIDTDTVKVCQEYFDFELLSVMIEKRKKTFLSRLSHLDTLACSHFFC